MELAYTTSLGQCFKGNSRNLLTTPYTMEFEGKFDLILTSPPFLLTRKKSYGNLDGKEYIEWFADFASLFCDLLKPTGSIVIEMGNSWVKGQPVMSLLPLQALLAFIEKGNLNLCQQFIWNNPARLPGPAQWVNVERIRVKDAFTHIWWMSPTDRPKADNRNILKEYSQSMIKLLEVGSYNSGKRPSEHDVGKESFLKDNNGAIPSNVFTEEFSSVLNVSNTHANTPYFQFCRQNKLKPHPARMPLEIPEFFIKFLTDPGDWILDPFAGSNTTGEVAEKLDRKWVSVETRWDYIQGSVGRFEHVSKTETMIEEDSKSGESSKTPSLV